MDQDIAPYKVDFKIVGGSVVHESPGPTTPGCRGTWKKYRQLESEYGEGVEIQELAKVDANYKGPKILRAVKRRRRQDLKPPINNDDKIKRELWFMSAGQAHYNIVHLLCWYSDPQYFYIAMEFCHYGNLGDWLKAFPSQEENWAREVARQVLDVLRAMDAVNVSHRNIKPSNILIASPMPIQIKISDFDNAKCMNQTSGSIVGTLPYAAPEIRKALNENGRLPPYDTKVDVWSVGIVLHEILTGKHPFSQPGRRGFSAARYNRYIAGQGEITLDGELEENRSSGCVEFLRLLLAREAAMRPTAKDALEDKWFSPPTLHEDIADVHMSG